MLLVNTGFNTKLHLQPSRFSYVVRTRGVAVGGGGSSGGSGGGPGAQALAGQHDSEFKLWFTDVYHHLLVHTICNCPTIHVYI